MIYLTGDTHGRFERMFLFCFPQIPAIMIILLNVVFHLHALVVIDYEPAIWEKALRHPRMGGCIVQGDG